MLLQREERQHKRNQQHFLRDSERDQYSKPSDGPCRIYIYYNDFDDDGSRPSGVPMEDHCIYFGDSKPKGDDVVCMEDVELDHNLIRDSNKRVRGFYLKRGAYLFQNSLLGARYNWGIRHGGNARIEANIAKGSAKLVLNGKGHKLYNNSWEKQCDLYAGASKNGRGPLYQAASDAELDMNEGPAEYRLYLQHPPARQQSRRQDRPLHDLEARRDRRQGSSQHRQQRLQFP